MSSFAHIPTVFADNIVPAPTTQPSLTLTTFEACMALVGEAPTTTTPAAWSYLWMQRLREFSVPVGPDVDAVRWTQRLLSCVRFHGVGV